MRTYEPLLGAAIIYVILVFLLTRVINVVERYLNRDRQQPPSSGPKIKDAAIEVGGPA